MNPPALRALIRRILLPIFIISLLISSGGSYLLLYNEGIRQAEQEARIMLASARAVGEYTGSVTSRAVCNASRSPNLLIMRSA